MDTTTKTTSKTMLRAGWIVTCLCILFLLFDAIMKIIKERHSMEGSVKLGWPAQTVQPIGILLLLCTILYAIPRTAILGAILVTAYLGGATAIMVGAGQPFLFPVIFGVLVWAGVYWRSGSIRSLIPFNK